MKQLKKTLTFVIVFVGVVLTACQTTPKVEGESDFRMILRLWQAHHNNDTLSNQLLETLPQYPGLWDEVWFCTDGDKYAHPELQASSAQKMGEMAERLREIGVTPSVQCVLIGHADPAAVSPSDNVPTEWSTAVGMDGQQTRTINCPRQKAYLDYIEKSNALYAAACQPRTVFIDDDLRCTHHEPADPLCFCDTCLTLFNQEYGHHYDRVSLLRDLEENKGNGTIRKEWIRFTQESLAGVARAAARGIHRVSPHTLVGLQHAAFHQELLEGYDWTPIFDAIREETGMAPVSRPGHGFYDDHAPRGMIWKAFGIARQVRRLPDDIVEIASEIEGWPHRATDKSPHGLCVESHLYLAMGVTQLSYAIICSGVEPLSWYADNYFRALAPWKDYLKTYADLNRGTAPGGIDPYISPNHVLRPKEEGEAPFAWRSTYAVEFAINLAPMGLPFCPDGSHPVAYMLDQDRLRGMTEEEGKYLFTEEGLVVDAATWQAAVRRGFTEALRPVDSPFEEVQCFESAAGGRVAVIPAYAEHISNTERLRLVQTFDWASRQQLPVLSETSPQLMVVPRVEPTGTLRSVFVLNPTISPQREMRLRLRNVPDGKLVWRRQGEKDLYLSTTQDGDDLLVVIPALAAWNTGYLAWI